MRAGIALGLTLAAIVLIARRDHPGTGAEGGDEEPDGVGVFTELGNILNNGKFSPQGLATLARVESFSPVPYVDDDASTPGTEYSIGYGHQIRAGESFDSITPDEGLQLLAFDVAWAEAAVNKSVSVPLTQEQFDALVMLCFNIGEDKFKRSTLVRLLNESDYMGAAAQFDRWNRSGGQVTQALVIRRAAERELFEGGVPT